MKLLSIFKNKEITRHEEWQWPSCTHPKTQSFRAEESIFKTLNSIYFDPFGESETASHEQESWFSNSSSDSASFSGTESNNEEYFSGGLDESMEMIIRGVKSDRLFFEPEDTNSILEVEIKAGTEEENGDLFKESVVLAMESEDPYLDFKKSMEEMVETHGMNDWESMEEMLEWYLKMNGKMNHGFIVGAFVDLMIKFVSSSDYHVNCDEQQQQQQDDSCFMSASSTMSSPPLSPTVNLNHRG